MSYRIEAVTGREEYRGIAEFLAKFVREGGLAHPLPGDEDPLVWERRFGWWWDQNPHRRDDSPLGFILKTDRGDIVGFMATIPFDYEFEGCPVPTLVTSTLFVEERHRSAVMGIIARERRLAKTFQLIDGSPSPEMVKLLEKVGYRAAGPRHQYFFPLAFPGAGFLRALLCRLGLSVPLLHESGEGEDTRIVTSPDHIRGIPSPREPSLQRSLSKESLDWLHSSGSNPRAFFGLCDSDGTLLSHAIGIYKRKGTVTACILMDYSDRTSDGSGFRCLLGHLVKAPVENGLRPDTRFLAWSVHEGNMKPTQRGLRRKSSLYFHLPPHLSSCERTSLPIEGDLALL